MKGYFSILLFKMHFCKLKVCKAPFWYTHRRELKYTSPPFFIFSS